MLAARAVLPNETTEFTEEIRKGLPQPTAQPKAKKSWKHKTKLMKYGFLLLLYAGLLVVLQLKGSMLSYQITSLKQDIGTLQTANYRAEYEIQQLSSLDRIEMIAMQELNMVRPEWNHAYTVAKIVIPPVLVEESLLADIVILEEEKPMVKIYNAFLALPAKQNRSS